MPALYYSCSTIVLPKVSLVNPLCQEKPIWADLSIPNSRGYWGLVIPTSFFQPWQWGEGAIFQYPHCLSHLSLPPICSTLCMLSFPCGYQLQGWCCHPRFLCVNRALDVILSTLLPCPPLVSILFIFHFNMLLQSPPLRYPSFSPSLSHSQHLLC